MTSIMSTAVILFLLIVLIAIVVIYLFRKGPSCGSSCSRCSQNCSSRKASIAILFITLALSLNTNVLAQNPNERFSFHMKDGSAAKISVSKLAGMAPYKTDINGNPTEEYECFLIVTKDGKAAALPLKDIARINHINGEPTDGTYGATWFEIQREWGAHAEVVMLNSINNYNNGVGVITQQYDNNWCGQRTGYPVYFLATCDMGYEVNFTVRGLDSGFDYSGYNGYVFWLTQDDERNPCGQSCWCFYMGEEPVIIEASATEITDYEEYPWLGDYYGHPVALTESYVLNATSAATAATRLSLKGNKSYIFSSSVSNPVITSSMLYDYADESFHYKGDESGDLTWRGDKDYYGLVGKWITSDLIYLRADNVNIDKPENSHRYFMLKDGDRRNFSAVIGAKDNWNGRSTQYLAELKYDGGTSYYYMDNYGAGIYPAEVSFVNGTTISDKCEAVVTYVRNGETKKFRYLSADGTNPEFLPYKEEKPDLPESAEWTGSNLFQNEQALGVYDGKESATHHVYVRMDQNINGTPNKGYCSVRIDFNKGYSYDTYAISSGGEYIYNPQTETITVKQVLVGVAGGGQTERRDLTLRYDKTSNTLEFDAELCGESICSSRTNTYIKTGSVNKLTAMD